MNRSQKPNSESYCIDIYADIVIHNLESQVLEVLSDNRLRSFLAWDEVIVSPKHFLSINSHESFAVLSLLGHDK